MTSTKRPKKKVDGGDALREAVAAMKAPDRRIAERLHELITAAGPELEPRTWYGMPAYSLEGKVLCFFRGTEKFTERYLTLGFNDIAALDAGSMWPITYAITDLSKADEKVISALIEKAVGR